MARGGHRADALRTRAAVFSTWRRAPRTWPSARRGATPASPSPGVDFAAPMLAWAVARCGKPGLERRIELREADAMSLPFPDATFDVASVAFGLRNIPDRLGALREMARVTAPGGQVMVLEMTFAPARPFRPLYGVVPPAHPARALARLFARDVRTYYYLGDSITAFSRSAGAARPDAAGGARPGDLPEPDIRHGIPAHRPRSGEGTEWILPGYSRPSRRTWKRWTSSSGPSCGRWESRRWGAAAGSASSTGSSSTPSQVPGKRIRPALVLLSAGAVRAGSAVEQRGPRLPHLPGGGGGGASRRLTRARRHHR